MLGIEPRCKKFGELTILKLKSFLDNLFIAIKGVMPFGKKYIGVYQPLADTNIISL